MPCWVRWRSRLTFRPFTPGSTPSWAVPARRDACESFSRWVGGGAHRLAQAGVQRRDKREGSRWLIRSLGWQALLHPDPTARLSVTALLSKSIITGQDPTVNIQAKLDQILGGQERIHHDMAVGLTR
jgi:hypothetical protein